MAARAELTRRPPPLPRYQTCPAVPSPTRGCGRPVLRCRKRGAAIFKAGFVCVVRAYPRALGNLLLRHALRDLERVLHDARDQSVAVRPVRCALVVRLHDDRLLAGLPSVEEQHHLAGLQELGRLLRLGRHDICTREQWRQLKMALGAVRAGLGRVGGIGLLARTPRICICRGVLSTGPRKKVKTSKHYQ